MGRDPQAAWDDRRARVPSLKGLDFSDRSPSTYVLGYEVSSCGLGENVNSTCWATKCRPSDFQFGQETFDSAERVDSCCEAADGGRGVLAGKHLDDGLGGAKQFHRSPADVGAVAILFGAVQVAVLT